MTLLGCVPVENLAETGSNVKLAAESRTEQEHLKLRFDVLKQGMIATKFSPHLMIVSLCRQIGLKADLLLYK